MVREDFEHAAFFTESVSKVELRMGAHFTRVVDEHVEIRKVHEPVFRHPSWDVLLIRLDKKVAEYAL